MKSDWLCEVQAPPELHESIEQFFNALSCKLRHADGWMAGYEYGLEKAGKIIQCKDCIYYKEYRIDDDNKGSYCKMTSGFDTVYENDFCSKAERKAD